MKKIDARDAYDIFIVIMFILFTLAALAYSYIPTYDVRHIKISEPKDDNFSKAEHLELINIGESK